MRRGFTLLEILIVLAIMAVMITWGAGKIRRQDTNIKSVARKFTVLGKEIRNHARLNHATFRLVLKMDGDKHQYWVERATGAVVVDPKQLYDTNKKDNSDDKNAKPPPFQIDKSIYKKIQELPPELYFGSVETINHDGPVTSGEAYIHFFPEGLVESTAIQITNRKKLTWTLIFNPMTGQGDIAQKALSLKDIKR